MHPARNLGDVATGIEHVIARESIGLQIAAIILKELYRRLLATTARDYLPLTYLPLTMKAKYLFVFRIF
jgi:hypothetical protein